MSLEQLAQGVRAAHKPAVARALNLIEDQRPEAERQMTELLTLLATPSTEPVRGHRVGLTGPPGVGKSSLVAVFARELRERGHSVGVVAVDPSSVHSGGALLGDRARMGFDPQDQGLFVRSLATRGALGGLAHSTHAAVEIMSAAYDIALVETVGVGQTEVAITHVSDTVVLVVQPGSGDVLQFLKAGVMEIPDLLVVNKADHGATAQRAASDLRAALATLRQVGAGEGGQRVVLTSARDRAGIDGLADAVSAHRAELGDPGLRARRRAGRLSWAHEWLVRRVGSLGIGVLGGLAQVGAQLGEDEGGGVTPLVRAQALAGRLSVRLAP